MRAVGLVLIYCLSFGAKADSWDEVLRLAGLNRQAVQFDAIERSIFYTSPYQLPLLVPMHDRPLRLPFYARTARQFLFYPETKPIEVYESVVGRTGVALRRTLVGDPLAGIEEMAKKSDGLSQAMRRLYAQSGTAWNSSLEAQLAQQSEKLSADMKMNLAYLIGTLAQSISWRNKAFAGMESKDLQKAFGVIVGSQTENSGSNLYWEKLVRMTDFPFLAVGAQDLFHGLIKTVERLQKPESKLSGTFKWLSPFGWIQVGGTGSDQYSAKQYLLILDVGGNDQYLSGAGTVSFQHAASIILDLAGDDQYLETKSLEKTSIAEFKDRKKSLLDPKFGAGVFGYGMLVDLAGKDLYRSVRLTQGRGSFGHGVLWDLDGEDLYDCYRQCQASAEFGAAMLWDKAGKDRYDIFQEGQGYGGTLGSGLLFDSDKSDDSYTANNKVIDFPALVDAKHNTSMAQGMGNGMRADIVDGHSMAGGYGSLVDGGGNNQFEIGFFGQGSSYWYGIGLLSLGDGRDVLKAGKYAQGAGAHHGVGVLHNTGGNDSYYVEQELGIGHGHDYSVGFLFDEAGDDEYVAPDFSLGCASSSGMGFLWDVKGDDRYQVTTKDMVSLGCSIFRNSQAVSLRNRARTLGVFLDTGGTNFFDTKLKTASGKLRSASWQHEPRTIDLAKPWMNGVGLVVQNPEQALPE